MLTMPVFVVVPLICTPLALYIVGYTSRLSSGTTHLRKYREELALRKSSTYKYREGFVALIAIAFGVLAFYLSLDAQELDGSGEILLAGVMFLALGVWSLIGVVRGRDNTPVPTKKILNALKAEIDETGDFKELESAMRRTLVSRGMSEEQIAEIEADVAVRAQHVVKELKFDVERRISNNENPDVN